MHIAGVELTSLINGDSFWSRIGPPLFSMKEVFYLFIFTFVSDFSPVFSQFSAQLYPLFISIRPPHRLGGKLFLRGQRTPLPSRQS
ncbi:hypothetical protein AAFF_G00149690 [Aldrovandia affinis]|uniref:Uncharacterized protein n=1 Tax=Aldrovandia affinis TaxID=143900 RepID=A0AAD7RPF0_9TELE|nr:hypothetical protein AAFF_G00149690 [Aldrovandia affinis]